MAPVLVLSTVSVISPYPKDILVVRVSAIGDTCHALAVVRNLSDNWPDARITWVIGKTEASLMAGIDGVEFIIFDKRKGLSAVLDVRSKLKGRDFDAALCMHASARINALYAFVASSKKIGFDRARARDFQWLFTNDSIGATRGKHALEAMLMFARRIGAEETPLRFDIPVSEEHVEFARTFRDAGRPLVLISPCSSSRSRNYRNWDADRFVAVIEHAVQQYDARVVITGGRSDIEHDYGQQLSGGNDAVTDLTARTDLKQLYALIAEADVVVCPDSGPAHMATAAGTPVVGLYATSNPARTGPYLSADYTVNRYPDAARRFLGKTVEELRWWQRVRSPDAMNLIKINEVCDKIDKILR